MKLSERQLKMMMSALGIDPVAGKLRMFRNRYCNIGTSTVWEELVSMGLAEAKKDGHYTWYFVTSKGKNLVRYLTGAKECDE